jgi:hypothetical protein
MYAVLVALFAAGAAEACGFCGDEGFGTGPLESGLIAEAALPGVTDASTCGFELAAVAPELGVWVDCL